MKKWIWRGIGVGILLCTGVMIWLLDFGSWVDLDMEKLTNLSQTTVIYDSEGQPVAGLHNGENRSIVPVEEIPDHVKNAFIAMEDARFYDHPGIDIWRIGGALLSNIRSGGYREGASTITQQLIKLTHLTSEKKLSRKAQEAWLALKLEKQASKDEILGMYLNVVYFGKGAYGIETAAQTYFGKGCQELTISEGALLAGIIKAPGNYAPHINLNKAIERRNLVLDAMVKENMITSEISEQAKSEEVLLAKDTSLIQGGWYTDWVLKEAGEALHCSVEEMLSGGYHIYTALNTDMQSAAEALFANKSYFPEDAPDGIRPESALIAIDPDNGDILCMVGGRSYDTRRGLNRAMQIQRQPGSAFKPISVYAAAIDFLGYTPLSLIEDVQRDFGGGYTPSNASGNAYGTVTLRQALSRSMNLATVDLITRTGIQSAAMYARRAGIALTEDDLNLSLSLGSLTEGVSPARLCAAYAPLSNGGHSVQPHTVLKITDIYGQTLFEHEENSEYVMDKKSARMITDILEETAASGTARALSSVRFPVAAKTGTVGYKNGGNRDAWTVAYTPSVTVTVWLGFDQPDDMHILPNGTTGGTYPARLAAAFLKETETHSNGGEFPVPQGMREILIDGSSLYSGSVMLAAERTPKQYLLAEILPDEKVPLITSDRWNDPKRVEAVYTETSSDGYPVISFISPDSNALYRIIRIDNIGEQTEVGCITGTAGSYLSYTDQYTEDAQYYIISRHKGFLEAGLIVESEPSELQEYHAPSLLQRMLLRQETSPPIEEPALFGEKSQRLDLAEDAENA